ncbi:sialic acid-binding Ig-like lectin 16 isoform 2-T2 [Trichechus inunguis]
MPLLLLLLLSLLWGIECVGSQGSQAGAGASTNPRSPRWYSDLEDGYQLQVQKSVTVQEGLCVFIPCIFSYPPDGWKDSDPVLGYWFQEQAYNFNHEQVAPVATNNPYRKVDSQTRDRFQLLGEPWNRSCSLVIRDAQRRDTATYFFRVERGNTVKFNFKKYTLALEVTGLTQKPDVYVPETLEPGRPVTLLCVFPGDFEGCPAPKFSWTGVAVSPQGAEPRASLFSALTLTPRPQDNDTELTCRVNFSRNGVSAMRTIRLSVAEKSNCGIEFAQAAFVGAGLAALFFLCPGLIFLMVKTLKRKAIKTAAGRSDAPSVLGTIPWEEEKTHRQTQKEDRHVKMEGKIGVMHLQAKKRQGLPGTTRSWKRSGKIFPWSLQREHGPVNILISNWLSADP